MTLSPCRTCGQPIAPSARACPSCGDRRPLAPSPTGDAARFGERHELLTLLYALIAAGIAISILAVLMQ